MRLKVLLACLLGFTLSLSAAAQTKSDRRPATGGAPQAMSARYEDLKWQIMVPELRNDSPQISILRVDLPEAATGASTSYGG